MRVFVYVCLNHALEICVRPQSSCSYFSNGTFGIFISSSICAQAVVVSAGTVVVAAAAVVALVGIVAVAVAVVGVATEAVVAVVAVAVAVAAAPAVAGEAPREALKLSSSVTASRGFTRL